jgi:hypothetical protein
VLAILVVVVTAWISFSIFERMPHVEDEFANLWEAHAMAEGEIFLSSPPVPRAFFIPFVIDYQGRRFAKYPPGWPAILSLAVRAGLTYLVSPMLAGLAVWLVYRLGSKISRPEIGLLAALLAGTSPILLMLSGTLMPHPWSLVLTLAFTLAWMDLFPASTAPDSPRLNVPAWLLVVVAGLSLGTLVLTRPLTAVGVSLPFALHGLMLLIRGPGRRRLHAIGVAGLVLLVAMLYPLWQAAVTGDPLLNPYTLWWSYDKVGFGPGHGRIEDGHNLRSALLTMYFTLRAGMHDFFGWPYLSWIFLPFGIVALWRNRNGWLALSVFPSLVVVHFAYWVGSWLFGPRYYYESLPGLSIATALGVAWLGGWGSESPRWRLLRRRASLALLALLILINITMYLPQRISGMHGLYGVERSALEQVQEADLGKALLIVHTAESWYEYGRLITLGPPFVDGDLILALSRRSDRDRQVIEAYPEHDVIHYYPDEPTEFYADPR